MWHKGSGVIYYDPPRPGMKRRTDWWCIVDVDREISRYYRWWVMREKWIDLCKPSWDCHISVIRGEKPSDDLTHLWRKYHGQRVDFLYSHEVRPTRSGTFWFIEVQCPELMEIRKEFGLPTNWPLHITIGRIYS